MSDDIAADVERLRGWAKYLVDRFGPWGGSCGESLQRVLAFLEDQSRLCVALAERCRAQAELLAKRAEREGV